MVCSWRCGARLTVDRMRVHLNGGRGIKGCGGLPTDQRMAAGCILDRDMERKMEFQLNINLNGALVFRIGAIVNWLVAIGGFIDPTWVAHTSGIVPANYPFLVRIWTGMVIMFGAMFWEISSDMDGKRHLIKYAWIEKSITALSVTIGYVSGRAPGKIIILIIFTDYVWIPVFLYYDCLVSARAQRQHRQELET